MCEACLFPLGSCADLRSSNSERKPMAFISVVKSGTYSTVRSGTYKGKLLMNLFFPTGAADVRFSRHMVSSKR